MTNSELVYKEVASECDELIRYINKIINETNIGKLNLIYDRANNLLHDLYMRKYGQLHTMNCGNNFR